MAHIRLPQPLGDFVDARLGIDIFVNGGMHLRGIPLRPAVIWTAELRVMSPARRGQKATECDDPFVVLHQFTIPLHNRGVTGKSTRVRRSARAP